jgi:hypothetical protein
MWLASSAGRLPKIRGFALLALVVAGCAARDDVDVEADFRARFKQGTELLAFAHEQSGSDASAEHSLLVDAREEFLRAALLQPGHIDTARRITTITGRLGELEAVIAQQRAEQRQRDEKLSETIQRLQKLTERQEQLARHSRRALRSRPAPSGEEANLPGPEWANEPFPMDDELDHLAAPIRTQQRAVRKATASVLDRIALQQQSLRQLLTRAYGEIGRLPETEVDPIADLLAETVAAQDEALANLAPAAVTWPRANTALHVAAGRMRQALDDLRGLQPPTADDQDDSMPPRNVGDDDENLDGPDDQARNKGSQTVSPGDFQQALSLRSLPIPDYTSAQIMAEEAANQQKRARRKAARAGAQVEKNW